MNDGLHNHVILLMPAQLQLRTGLALHFKYHRLYPPGQVAAGSPSRPPIDTDPGHVMRYALKALKNGRLPYDDCVLVLPKSVTELPRADTVDQVRPAA